jgi:hypothetical protein
MRQLMWSGSQNGSEFESDLGECESYRVGCRWTGWDVSQTER